MSYKLHGVPGFFLMFVVVKSSCVQKSTQRIGCTRRREGAKRKLRNYSSFQIDLPNPPSKKGGFGFLGYFPPLTAISISGFLRVKTLTRNKTPALTRSPG